MSGRPQHFSETSGSHRHSPAIIPLTPFGKYTLVARLGRGGMAEVFLAFVAGPAGFRKPVVIKRILADLQSDERLVQMFFDEARLVARLSHPHVVQTYEVGEIEGAHFLAMEYLEGQPLHRILRSCAQRRLRVPPPIAARVAVDALEGLQYAHDLRDYDGTPLGVVHRDVSPQNIFVTYDGVVKVLDFGIAKSVTQVVQTRTGAIKGKYAYISPEQARGGELDARADVWAMGVVLWESLVGTRLFKGETDIATLEASLRGPIPRLSEIIPGSPQQLDAIVARALQRDPDQRYPSAQHMRSDLESYLRQQPAPVSRAELARYVRKLFADVLDDHQRLLATCMENVRTGQTDPGDGHDENVPETVPETPPSLDSHVRSAVAPPAREARSRLLPWLAVGLLLVGCGIGGALLAWLASGGSSGDPVADRSTETVPAASAPAPPAAAPAPAPIVAAQPEPEPEPEPVGEENAVEPAQEEPASAPSARRRRAGRTRGQRVAEMTEVEPARTEREPTAGRAGFLTLDTVPWSEVVLDGRVLGTTPLLGVELPAGTHILTLRNPEQAIETQYRVRITEGETTTRRLGL